MALGVKMVWLRKSKRSTMRSLATLSALLAAKEDEIRPLPGRVSFAAQSIAANCENVQIAGGVEHMHHIPMEAGFDLSPRFQYFNSIATQMMGLTAENVAEQWDVSREEMDRFAQRSQERAVEAQRSGFFAREITPYVKEDGTVVEVDDGPRADSTLERLTSLSPAFKEGGRVTAVDKAQFRAHAPEINVLSVA